VHTFLFNKEDDLTSIQLLLGYWMDGQVPAAVLEQIQVQLSGAEG